MNKAPPFPPLVRTIRSFLPSYSPWEEAVKAHPNKFHTPVMQAALAEDIQESYERMLSGSFSPYDANKVTEALNNIPNVVLYGVEVEELGACAVVVSGTRIRLAISNFLVLSCPPS